MEFTNPDFVKLAESFGAFGVRVESSDQFPDAMEQAFAQTDRPSVVVVPVDHHENPENHDTIGMVAVDADGNVAASCSTSGAGYKHAGRVGDSPIIGSGLYVDNEVGAAAATGLGEDIMRYCSSFAVVAHMARGLAPQEACLALLEQVRRVDPRGLDASVFLIAVNKEGQYGAAGMRPGLPYAVCEQGKIQMHQGGWLET